MRHKSFSLFALLPLGLFLFLAACGQATKEFDLLILNGRIVDGTGNPWFRGDIGVAGGRIAEMGRLAGRGAARVIDAAGLAVAPGFIDLHTHCDEGLGNPGTNANLNYLTQGVTTVVTGNCGGGDFRIQETRTKWEKQGIGSNAAPLVGFGTVRKEVLGVEERPASAAELETMRSLFRRAMEEGAWGLSTGLQYIPDRYASTEEVIALAKVVAEFDGLYASHQRDEEARLVEAVAETVRIGREAGIRVNASHLKAAGKSNWGLMKSALALINEARSQGVDITADMYSYDKAATTPLLAIFNVPKGMAPLPELRKKLEDEATPFEERLSLFARYADELAAALADGSKRGEIRRLTVEGDPEKVNWVKTWGWHNFTIVSARKNSALIGRILSDLGEEQKRDPFDIAADLFIEEKNEVIISLASMSEDDMRLAMAEDWLMFGSDGAAIPFEKGPAHPRNYGNFPLVFRKFVREHRWLTLEQAVRKMTSLPARALQLRDRGILAQGLAADIVVFDPGKITDEATYLQPHRYSSGVEFLVVNGRLSIDNGRPTGALNGRVLLRPTT